MPWTTKGKLNALEGLDLQPIGTLLIQKKQWTPEQVKEAEIAYRRFLALIILNPGETLVPTDQIDEFWHMHILDSRKYEQDCKAVFGKYLHHDPHLAKGTAAHTKAYERTKKIESTTYGDNSSTGVIPFAACGGSTGGSKGGGSSCGNDGGSSCGSSCSGGSSCGGGGCSGGCGGD